MSPRAVRTAPACEDCGDIGWVRRDVPVGTSRLRRDLPLHLRPGPVQVRAPRPSDQVQQPRRTRRRDLRLSLRLLGHRRRSRRPSARLRRGAGGLARPPRPHREAARPASPRLSLTSASKPVSPSSSSPPPTSSTTSAPPTPPTATWPTTRCSSRCAPSPFLCSTIWATKAAHLLGEGEAGAGSYPPLQRTAPHRRSLRRCPVAQARRTRRESTRSTPQSHESCGLRRQHDRRRMSVDVLDFTAIQGPDIREISIPTGGGLRRIQEEEPSTPL